MKKIHIITLVVLIMLTILTALFSIKFNALKNVSTIILTLSIVKFLLVAFQYMELKKAHVLWKGVLITFLAIFFMIILVSLN